MPVYRIRAVWDGWPGAPGVSTFFQEREGGPDLASIEAFIDGFRGNLPNNVGVTLENVGQTIDISTGQANGSWTAAARTRRPGAGGINYSAVCGMYVSWRTGAFVNGREIRGKTFIVPLAAAVYDADGNIGATALTAVQTAATAYADAANGAVVYSKIGAGTAAITSAKAVDKAVVLRTRRP